MSRLLAVYRKEAAVGVQGQAQYRVAVFFSILGFLIEPIVYLVVWRTVAESAGDVNGYDVAAFTSYYIVWTLVRNMNLVQSAYSWDWWIQSGRISESIIRPVNLFHRRLGGMAGFKVIWIMAWLPIAAGLSIAFRPELSPSGLEIVAFLVAIWLGYVIRFATFWVIGMLSFWVTRASAIFETVMVGELLLGGRLVPLAVMPAWVSSIAAWLPFKWTFQFPIEVLIGRLTPEEIYTGIATQLVWIVVLGALVAIVWKRAVVKYTAVGS